jgi:hypothetical protein
MSVVASDWTPHTLRRAVLQERTVMDTASDSHLPLTVRRSDNYAHAWVVQPIPDLPPSPLVLSASALENDMA